jgi:membrane protein DedA with SNARE-associated domain/membrane-associated phospholipid phosphatase
MITLAAFLAWAHHHQHIIGMVMFTIAYFESLVVVGLVLPGTLLLSGIGMLIGAQVVSFGKAWGCITLGAILGDLSSYGIGYWLQKTVYTRWPFRKYPHLIQKYSTLLQNNSVKSIIIGKFVGVMRPIMPMVCGMATIPLLFFFSMSLLANVLWVPVYLLPGILMGTTHHTGSFIAGALLLAVFMLTGWVIRALITWLHHIIRGWFDGMWHLLYRSLKLSARYQNSAWLFRKSMAILLACGALSWLSYHVMHASGVVKWNLPLHHYFTITLRHAWLTHILVEITNLGSFQLLTWAVLSSGIYLLYQRCYLSALIWMGVFFSSEGCIGFLKWWIGSTRPYEMMYRMVDNSFPSGHVTLSVVVYGMLYHLTAPVIQSFKGTRYVRSAWLLLMGTVAFSRLYLSAHWATDVIGGLLLGYILLSIGKIAIGKRYVLHNAMLKGFLVIFALSLTIGMSSRAILQHTDTIAFFEQSWPDTTQTISEWWSQDSAIPLYRTSRMGKTNGIFNVQWAGNLSNIKKTLANSNWIVEQDHVNWLDRLYRTVRTKQTVVFPLLPDLYLGKLPILSASHQTIMGDIIVLQLWSSNATFSDTVWPLWVGTVTGFKTPLDILMNKPSSRSFGLTPIEFIKVAIFSSHYYHRHLYTINDAQPLSIPDDMWQSGILLIYPDNEVS